MGCGQSKIGIYQRKSKNKKNGSKRSAENEEKDEETEDGEDTVDGNEKDCGSNEKPDEETDSIITKIKQITQQQQQQQQQQQTSGAVLAQSDISSSQLDFFKMLDEKIENGPDYEESDEEEQKERMANLLQEWKNACLARQQKKSDSTDENKWVSSGRTGKPFYQEDCVGYLEKRINLMAAQRVPTAYAVSPGNNILAQNSLKMNSPTYMDQQSRLQPRLPLLGNYHPYQTPSEAYNNRDATSILSGHVVSSMDPINPLRPQVLLRQSSINSQVHQYAENQRLYPESIRQYSDFSRPYQDQRFYYGPRNAATTNVMYEHGVGSGLDVSVRTQQIYQKESRPSEEVQRMAVTDLPRQYADPQRSDPARQFFGAVDDQRMHQERSLEKQKPQCADGARPLEGSRVPTSFQRPSFLAQRSIPDPRVYRDLDADECCIPRSERFAEDSNQEGSAYRPYNPSHFKGGRPLNVEVHYLAGPPPPRELIPVQGAPGPFQGSPRPLVVRNLQPNMHRLPANTVVHFRKPQGAFT